MTKLQIIAFDADDTLWHNERLYMEAQDKFERLLAHYHNPDWVGDRLYQTELRNLPHFGYGIKAFALSMIETAVELTEGRITGSDIQTLVDMAKGMLSAPVVLLDYAAETVERLAKTHTLMLITKGDLLDQESKIARSGLAQCFRYVEIVSNKRRETYALLLEKHGVAPAQFLMVGNSLRSDILPVLQLGAYAVYVPFEQTWAHEVTGPPPPGQPRYFEIEHLGQLVELVERIEGD